MLRRFPPGSAAKGGQAAAPVLRQLADEHYRPLYGLAVGLRAQGLSLAAIAAELNARGERTRVWGTVWNPTQVGRLLARAQRLGIQPPPPPTGQAQAVGDCDTQGSLG